MSNAVRYIVTKVERETEKAIMVENDRYDYDGNVIAKNQAWLPKSQVKVYHTFSTGFVAIAVPFWLVKKNCINASTKAIVDELVRRDS